MDLDASTSTQPAGETGSQTEILLGRQAIFDRRDRVVAHEQHRWDEVIFRGLRTEEICKYYL